MTTEPTLPVETRRAGTAVHDWGRLLLATAARAVLCTLGGLLLWGGLPAVIGWHPTAVLTGSMQPRLMVGDLAVSRPVETSALRVNQVLLFTDPDHPGHLRLHRFVAVADDGALITRGDANKANDSTPVAATTVKGVATLRIPFVAAPRVWLQEQRWAEVGGTAVALLLLVAASGLDRHVRARLEAETGPAEPKPRRAAPRRTLGAPARTVAGVAAAVAVLAAAWTGSAHAAYADSSGSTGNKLAASTYYRCSSAVAADGARIWYRFDETSGTTAADSSGNSRPATYRGGVTLGAAKACRRDTGTALTLNGSTGYVSSNQAFTTPQVFSLETWFKTTTSRGGRLIGFGSAATGASTTADRQIYMTNAGKLVFGVMPSTTRETIASGASYNDGDWHHVVASLSDAGMVLYVDGTKVASDTTVTSAKTYAGYLRIGYDSLTGWADAPTSSYFAGSLDDAAVYVTAFSAADAADHANAGD